MTVAGAASRVECRQEGAVATITVGDGARRNALRTRDWLDLADTVQRLNGDPTLRVVVLRGSDGSFCAGHDIAEWTSASAGEVASSFEAMEAAFAAVEATDVPVIAEVRGQALGGGFQLLLSADIRLLAEDASVGMPIARLGVDVPPAFAKRITSNTLPAAGRLLTLSGRFLSAEEAWRAGLATAVVRPSALERYVHSVIDDLCGAPPGVLSVTKKAMRAATEPTRSAAAAAPTIVSLGYFHDAVKRFTLGRLPAPTHAGAAGTPELWKRKAGQ